VTNGSGKRAFVNLCGSEAAESAIVVKDEEDSIAASTTSRVTLRSQRKGDG